MCLYDDCAVPMLDYRNAFSLDIHSFEWVEHAEAIFRSYFDVFFSLYRAFVAGIQTECQSNEEEEQEKKYSKENDCFFYSNDKYG